MTRHCRPRRAWRVSDRARASRGTVAAAAPRGEAALETGALAACRGGHAHVSAERDASAGLSVSAWSRSVNVGFCRGGLGPGRLASGRHGGVAQATTTRGSMGSVPLGTLRFP